MTDKKKIGMFVGIGTAVGALVCGIVSLMSALCFVEMKKFYKYKNMDR